MFVTDTRRASAASDVAHEINELRVAWEVHKSVPFAWTAWFVHARNLMRFFDGVADHDDDILARHFFDPPGHWDGIRERLEPPSTYGEYEKAAHKLAAHLTYGRSKYRRNGLPPSKEITEHLLQRARDFVAALPPDDRAWFDGVFG